MTSTQARTAMDRSTGRTAAELGRTAIRPKPAVRHGARRIPLLLRGGAPFLVLVFTACLAQPPVTGPGASAGRPQLQRAPAGAVQPDRGRCRGEGQDIDGKDLGPRCCSDLKAIPIEEPEGALCRRQAPPSVFVCTRCGDGICGKGENRCNCPADCRKPPNGG